MIYTVKATITTMIAVYAASAQGDVDSIARLSASELLADYGSTDTEFEVVGGEEND